MARLEPLTWTRVAAQLRGKRDESLLVERTEAEAVGHRVTQAQTQRDALRAELAEVDARLAATAKAPTAYAALVADREHRLLTAGTGPAAQLADIAGRRR
ncbi:hypothetical protein ACQP2F_14130 [Actinoplanes sp. CA-030573]|uniref:hypothetical protein n=1 Tax=Actinoplanes sp. CA-030573 TaxID=3239898 RepID=UPI003D8AAE31